MRAAIVLSAAIAVCQAASAAEISLHQHPDPKQVPWIIVRGPFVRGDSAEFERRITGQKRGLVVLSSPGGSVAEALKIGAAVRTQGLATMVVDECASACGLIWLSGVRRYYNEGARIGFHAAYIMQDGKPFETGMGNAEIGSFLTHLGLNIDAIRFITSAPPNGMRWLSREDARRLNIAVIEGQSTVDPSGKTHQPSYESKPVKPDEARKEIYGLATVTAALAIATTCKLYFRIDEARINREHKALMKEGEKFGDRFVDALSEILVEQRSELKINGHKAVCDGNRDLFKQIDLKGVYLN